MRIRNRGIHRAGTGRMLMLAIAFTSIVQIACDRGSKEERRPTSGPTTSPSSVAFPVELLGRFYQANGALEMDQSEEAATIYQELLEKGVRDPAVIGNLAIALLGLQKFDEADRLSREAALAAPGDPKMLLVRSACLAAAGHSAEAEALIRRIATEHPRHTAALWSLASRMESGGEPNAAELWRAHEHVLRQAPRNLVALLSTMRAAAAAGELSRVDELLGRIQAIVVDSKDALGRHFDDIRSGIESKNGTAVLRGTTIVRNLLRQTDRFRADVLALGPSGTSLPALIPHPIGPVAASAMSSIEADVTFESRAGPFSIESAQAGSELAGKFIAIGTVSDDRAPVLYLHDGQEAGRLFAWRDTELVDITQASGLASAPACTSAIFVDLNNDRRMDLLLCRADGNLAYRLGADGVFEEATRISGLRELKGSLGACPFDFDNDGDLDLLCWTSENLRIMQNDGEGGFAEIPPRPGVDGSLTQIHSIQPMDFDDDGDVDLLITRGNGPFSVRVISNERLATFRDVSMELSALPSSFAVEPMVVDTDNDGWLEIVDVAAGAGYEFDASFGISVQKSLSAANKTAQSGAIGDFDCDGRMDIIAVFEDGSTSNPGVKIDAGDRLTSLDLNGDGLLDLVSTRGRVFLNSTKNAGSWLSVGLHALIAGDSRFNSFGLYSTIEVRAGAHYQKRTVTSPTTHFGLGPYTHADVMRVIWPNGSYQNLEFRASDRMRLAANQLVIEEQSLKGSCPYLYAWDGEKFEFVTDVLWRSALGMSIMSGVYGHHGTADDYFKIPGEQLAARDGEFVLQFTEELWETAYFDYCRLFAIDHPEGTDVFVDEKCLVPPYPPFEIFKVETMREIVHATNNHGRDLTDLLRRRDDRFVGGFASTRYQGIVEDHDLMLDLGSFGQDESVRLFLTGWLWPTDASTNVAVSQNPAISVRPPQLSVRTKDSSWRVLPISAGFPSGKNKTLVYDLTGRFESEDHRVRLSTNFAIYWDHAFCTVGPQEFEMRTTILPVASAELHWRGFSQEFQRAADGPMIPDYSAMDESRVWRDLEGDYTRFGDVTGLLGVVDDRYVIVGAGDEITLRFDATSLPELSPGWRRDFIIHTDGWLKDGDLNSATGKTVEPLPFHGMSRFPYPASERGPNPPTSNTDPNGHNTRKRDQGIFRDYLKPKK